MVLGGHGERGQTELAERQLFVRGFVEIASAEKKLFAI